MSKKKQPIRANIPQETLARARAELSSSAAAPVVETSGASAVRTARPVSPVRAVTTVDDLHNEYTYVISDLRSMAILAGILFVALIVVALIVV
jgi:hypothetical protein